MQETTTFNVSIVKYSFWRHPVKCVRQWIFAYRLKKLFDSLPWTEEE